MRWEVTQPRSPSIKLDFTSYFTVLLVQMALWLNVHCFTWPCWYFQLLKRSQDDSLFLIMCSSYLLSSICLCWTNTTEISRRLKPTLVFIKTPRSDTGANRSRWQKLKGGGGELVPAEDKEIIIKTYVCSTEPGLRACFPSSLRSTHSSKRSVSTSLVSPTYALSSKNKSTMHPLMIRPYIFAAAV